MQVLVAAVAGPLAFAVLVVNVFSVVLGVVA